MESMQAYIPYLIPLVLVQISFQVLSLIQLFKPETRVRGDSKPIWAIVILVFQLFGVLVFQFVGKLPPDNSEKD